ncbi:unnamed protein product [Allacma fusca]|uniref:Uncharacterized protein n=1 Tax=Allacma fusca TaxID=39272 RepID=A0A8J2PS79_9HEXA|nr:unnamed protein product [Allacma fusca]
MSNLGDFEESSRAVPGDIDLDNEHIRLISEITEDGKNCKNSSKSVVYTICCFNGSASQSLAEAYLTSLGDKAVLISKAFLVYDRNTDSEDVGPVKENLSKRLVLSVYKVNNTLLVVTDQEQFGSSFSYQLLDSEVRPWIELARAVYVFHADSNSNFKSQLSRGSLYYLKSGTFGEKDMSELRKISSTKQLPMPNLIEHFSAALLIHCEMLRDILKLHKRIYGEELETIQLTMVRLHAWVCRNFKHPQKPHASRVRFTKRGLNFVRRFFLS